MTKKLAVLASGKGSLFEAIVEDGLPIELMVADRKCRALDIAKAANIPHVLKSRTFGKEFDRKKYTSEMLTLLREHNIDLVAMAGFMTVFSPLMFEEGAYQSKILNTHPSLLPAFTGAHAVQDAIEYGVKVSGCTIHWATKDLDAGPILLQCAVSVEPDDTAETLHERIKKVERQSYPPLLWELIK